MYSTIQRSSNGLGKGQMPKVNWCDIECNIDISFHQKNHQPLINLLSASDQTGKYGESYRKGDLVLEATQSMPHNALGENITIIRESLLDNSVCELLIQAGVIQLSGVSLDIDSQKMPVVKLIKSPSN